MKLENVTVGCHTFGGVVGCGSSKPLAQIEVSLEPIIKLVVVLIPRCMVKQIAASSEVFLLDF